MSASNFLVSTIYTSQGYFGMKGIAVDASGHLYVTDRGTCTLLKLDQQGNLTVLAGAAGARAYADGQGTEAKFYYPEDLVLAPDDHLYVADSYNNRIRRVALDGAVTTVSGSTSGNADGSLDQATFDLPGGITADAAGTLYVTDNGLKIRKIAGSTVTTLPERFWGNRGMALGPDGKLFLTTNITYGSQVFLIDTATGHSSVLAGKGVVGDAEGQGVEAQFNLPSGIVVDPHGVAYVVDTANNRIRRIAPDGTVSTVAGSTAGMANGAGTAAQFNQPTGIARDTAGNLYVTDTGNLAIRKLTPQS